MPFFPPFGISSPADIDAADASNFRQGTSTFNSTAGRTIALDPVEPNVDYQVVIEQLAVSGYVGEITIRNKAVNSFVVENSGSDNSTAFGWTLVNV